MAAKRRNSKKKKKNQVQVPFPVLLANVLVLVTVLGLSYMWLCARCDALGREIKTKEAELVSAQKRLASEQDHWSSVTSPLNLQRAIHRFGLEMEMPKESQIVKMGHWDSGGQQTAMSGMRSLLRP